MFFQSNTALTFFSSLSCVKTFYVATPNTHVMGYVQREQGWLKGWFSRRAIILGGPVIGDNATDEEVEELLNKLKNVTKEAIYTEIRCEQDYSAYRHIFERCGFEYQPHLNVKIECDSIANCLSRMDANRRRQIKRAGESGVEVRYAKNIDEVQTFYKLLCNHYKTKVHKPLFPWEFFEKMFASGQGRYLLAIKEDKIIGGMLQVADHDTVYDYYACGLDAEYPAESPSVILYWKTILGAIRSSQTTFDTMGAGTPGVPYGVRDFKLRFGGELVEHGRFIYVNHGLLYWIGKKYIDLIKLV